MGCKHSTDYILGIFDWMDLVHKRSYAPGVTRTILTNAQYCDNTVNSQGPIKIFTAYHKDINIMQMQWHWNSKRANQRPIKYQTWSNSWGSPVMQKEELSHQGVPYFHPKRKTIELFASEISSTIQGPNLKHLVIREQLRGYFQISIIIRTSYKSRTVDQNGQLSPFNSFYDSFHLWITPPQHFHRVKIWITVSIWLIKRRKKQ